MESRRPRSAHDLALIAVVIMWGLNFSVSKKAFEACHPLVFNALRFTVSVALLAALWRGSVLGAEARARFDLRLALQVIGLGLVGHVAYQVLFMLGLDRTTSGNSSLLLATTPIWTAIIASVFRLEVLRRTAWSGLAAAFLGSALLIGVGGGFELSNADFVGNAMTIGAAAAWGGYTAWNKPLLQRVTPAALAFWSMAAALPVVWLAAWPYLGSGGGLPREPWAYGAILYSGAFSSGLAYVLWNHGIRHVGPAQTAVYVCLVPVVALVVGALVLDESVSGGQFAGGALVALGLMLMRRGRAPAGAVGPARSAP